jgi:ribosome-binding protein aMBF1 (putative translation factor)
MEFAMKRSKIERLQAAGWKVGSVRELLNLSEDEESLIETKLALASGLRKLRGARGLTQAQLAERLGSSQSRIAKLEAADRTVSIDLLVRSLFALGATRQQVGRIFSRKAPVSAT